MFAPQPCKPPTAVGASQGRVALVAHRSERNSPERAKRVFSFWFFFSFARKEEKKNIETKCNYYLGYSGFNTQIGTPLFFLKPKAQKEKFPKEKRRSACGRRRSLLKKLRKTFGSLVRANIAPQTLIYRTLQTRKTEVFSRRFSGSDSYFAPPFTRHTERSRRRSRVYLPHIKATYT